MLQGAAQTGTVAQATQTPISEIELDTVELKEVAVPSVEDADELPDIEVVLEDEFDEEEAEPDNEEPEAPIDDGEIEFNTEDLSVEALGEDEYDDNDDNDIDEGVAPIRRTHKSGG